MGSNDESQLSLCAATWPEQSVLSGVSNKLAELAKLVPEAR